MNSVKGKVALVTGAAMGIGQACAAMLAAQLPQLETLNGAAVRQALATTSAIS